MPALEPSEDSTGRNGLELLLRWESPLTTPQMSLGEAHLWRVWLDSPSLPLGLLESLLSAEELERANRFRLNRDRDRFVLRRGLLRRILGDYLAVDPAKLKLHRGSHGKLYMQEEGGQSPMHFNLTHSSGMAVLAFTRHQELGVDIERINSLVAEERIPEQFFAQEEVLALRSLPSQLQTEAFFLGWTRKEAYIKATGEGLSHGLDHFAVSLRPDESARLLWVRGQDEERLRWSMMNFPPGPGFAGALVTEGPLRRIRAYSLGG